MEWILIPICLWMGWVLARASVGETRGITSIDWIGAGWFIFCTLVFLVLVGRVS